MLVESGGPLKSPLLVYIFGGNTPISIRKHRLTLHRKVNFT